MPSVQLRCNYITLCQTDACACRLVQRLVPDLMISFRGRLSPLFRNIIPCERNHPNVISRSFPNLEIASEQCWHKYRITTGLIHPPCPTQLKLAIISWLAHATIAAFSSPAITTWKRSQPVQVVLHIPAFQVVFSQRTASALCRMHTWFTCSVCIALSLWRWFPSALYEMPFCSIDIMYSAMLAL